MSVPNAIQDRGGEYGAGLEEKPVTYNEEETRFHLIDPVLRRKGYDDSRRIRLETPAPVEPTDLCARYAHDKGINLASPDATLLSRRAKAREEIQSLLDKAANVRAKMLGQKEELKKDRAGKKRIEALRRLKASLVTIPERAFFEGG